LLDMTGVFKTIGVYSAEEIGGDFVDVFPFLKFGIRSCGSSGVSCGSSGVSGGGAGRSIVGG
jgi:hypothetical protein